jgi:hypothetical protein
MRLPGSPGNEVTGLPRRKRLFSRKAAGWNDGGNPREYKMNTAAIPYKIVL